MSGREIQDADGRLRAGRSRTAVAAALALIVGLAVVTASIRHQEARDRRAQVLAEPHRKMTTP
ncbi:MAG: hypothetical protein ACLFV8_10320 [Alphaproteobacteria bacterium]